MMALVLNIKVISGKREGESMKIMGFRPMLFREHAGYFKGLSTNNITLIDVRKTNIKNAHKMMDYMIIIKEANGLN